MTDVHQAIANWARHVQPSTENCYISTQDFADKLKATMSVAGIEGDDTDADSGYIIINTGGAGYWTGSGAGGGGGGTLTGSTGGGGSLGSLPPATGTPGHFTYAISMSKPKTKVRYIVVKEDGKTLEMREKATITPREMIGISKFLSLTSVFSGSNAVYNTTISWSSLIVEFAIDGHFVDGLPTDDYPEDDEVFNIFLYDNS